ncbi:MAG: hypothetical protein PHS48_04310, partial [Bacteroidales bacterium]|nr:hypothetical protein [Bacteroidales bacterium]
MQKMLFVLGLALFMAQPALKAQEPETDPLLLLQQKVALLEAAQEKSAALKITGYIQTQWQIGEDEATRDVFAGGNFSADMNNRFMVRRGRLKVAYDNLWGGAVFQLDITEKGIGIKDAYGLLKIPTYPTIFLKTGVFDRPFGHEISNSSSRRESPERSRLFQSLFPDERDLGAAITLQPAKTSPWNVLKLEAGIFAGNGITTENNGFKDFIGHLSYNKILAGERIKLGLGVSYYNGGVMQKTSKVYSMSNGGFLLNDKESNIGEYARRQYTGVDLQLALETKLGLTQLRGELITGEQPGTATNNVSPKSSDLHVSDTYLRDTRGYYGYFIQDLFNTRHSLVVKYDYYDPNTSVSGDEIGAEVANGLATAGAADIAYG